MSQNNQTNSNIKLTARQKKIIELITQLTIGKPVTIANISEKLNLSTRTILREMPTIEAWFLHHQFQFSKKTGVGLLLEENVERHGQILELLDHDKGVIGYSKEERQRYILGELLATQEPVKSKYFIKKYQVSDGTLSNDLESIRVWCENYSIQMVRKTGLGIYLEGSEENFRQAIANVIYHSFDEKEVFYLLKGRHDKQTFQFDVFHGDKFLNLIDEETMVIVENILSNIESMSHIKHMDSIYMRMVLHISLAIKRIQNKEKIIMDLWKLDKLQLLEEYTMAKEIAKHLEEAFDLIIPTEEIGFITIHLTKTNTFQQNEHTICAEDINLRKIIFNMVLNVERILNMSFHEKEGLVDDILTHTLPMIKRLELQITIQNSQMNYIKEEYQQIFEAVGNSCAELKTVCNLKKIPEEEIAFISMYFCASMENHKILDTIVRVVVACPSGIGTSRMLAVNVKKNFSTIQIVDVISVMDISEEFLKQHNVDMVISTMELQIIFPVVIVNPILRDADKKKIETALETITKKRDVSEWNQIAFDKENMRWITEVGEEILHIISAIKIQAIHQSITKESLFLYVSSIFSKEEKTIEAIQYAFRGIYDISNYYIEDLKMVLLQVEVLGIEHGYLGYLRIEESIMELPKEIEGVLIVLVAEEKKKVSLEILEEITKKFIGDMEFHSSFYRFQVDDIHKNIEQTLIHYYQKMSLKRLGC